VDEAISAESNNAGYVMRCGLISVLGTKVTIFIKNIQAAALKFVCIYASGKFGVLYFMINFAPK